MGKGGLEKDGEDTGGRDLVAGGGTEGIERKTGL